MFRTSRDNVAIRADWTYWSTSRVNSAVEIDFARDSAEISIVRLATDSSRKAGQALAKAGLC